MLWETGLLHAPLYLPVQREAEEQRKAAEERTAPHGAYQRRKAQGLQDRYLYDYTFANDNGQNPLMDKARAYVENWRRHTETTPACCCLGCGNRQVLFRRLYRQCPA